MIEITVNELPRSIAVGSTITDLLLQLKIESPAIAVEINQELRPRDQYPSTIIEAGDVLEIVTLVGGG